MKKSFFAGVGEIRKAYKASHFMVLLMFEESYLTFDDTNPPLSSVVTSVVINGFCFFGFYISGIIGISAGNQNLRTTGPKDSLSTIIVQV